MSLGCIRIDFDYAPFESANQLLYDSSIVSQRLLAFRPYIRAHGLKSLHPAIKATFQTTASNSFRAMRTFEDIFTLAYYKHQAQIKFRNIDVIIVPSTVEHFTVTELQEEPLARNKIMGKFTNFVNLLDLCAVSVLVGWWKN